MSLDSPVACFASPSQPPVYDLAPSQDEFVDWARKSGVHDSVIAFLVSRNDTAGANPRQ